MASSGDLSPNEFRKVSCLTFIFVCCEDTKIFVSIDFAGGLQAAHSVPSSDVPTGRGPHQGETKGNIGRKQDKNI